MLISKTIHTYIHTLLELPLTGLFRQCLVWERGLLIIQSVKFLLHEVFFYSYISCIWQFTDKGFKTKLVHF